MNATPLNIQKHIETAGEILSKDGITSGPHGSYGQGHTCATMANTMLISLGDLWVIAKIGLSSDYWLQLANMKSDSVVITDKRAVVNIAIQ